MPTKTVDLLLNLEAKPAGTNDLLNRFKELEAKAKEIKKTLEGTKLMEGAGGGNVKRLEGELKKVHQEMKMIGAEAQKRTLEKSLKAAAAQANRLRERMEKVKRIGMGMMGVGAAIIAPFALALNKYVDTAKQAEEDRVSAAEKAMDEMKNLEKERVDVIRDTAEEIKDIDQEIADNRADLAKSNADAAQDLMGVREDLGRNLRDIKDDATKAQLEYNRAVEDIMSGGGSKQEKQKQLQRLKEDYNLVMKDINDARADAIRDAQRQQAEILKKQAEDAKKAAAEEKKLLEQKAEAKRKEQAELARIAAAERKIAKEKADAQAKYDKTAAGIVEKAKEWESINQRIGKLTAEVLLPALSKALDVMDKIVAFAEANPGVMTAILGIGASLVVLGGIVTTAAEIISAIAMVQELVAGAGLAGLGGAGAGGAGIASAISAGISAAGPIIAIAAAVIIAAELTRRLMNWVLGTDTTWKDIGTTLYQLVVIATEGWKILPGMLMEMVTNLSRQFAEIIMRSVSILSSSVRGFFTTLGQRIYDGFVKFGNYIRDGFGKLAAIFGARQRNSQGAQVRDSGGYVGKGLWANKGAPEFVLSNNTTRAAESVVGGGLTQARLLQALAGGGSKRVSYHDARRFDSMPSASARRMMTNEMMNALAGAL